MSYLRHGELTTLLPPLPPQYQDCGYDWIEELRGWRVVPDWGSKGWELGDWPYVIAAVCRTPARIWGLVTYMEGDIELWAFESAEELYEQVDVVAERWWRVGFGEGPPDLPAAGLKQHHKGRPRFLLS
jgi:hypothetical protein